jgi:uncharacterized coiled-coil protein SlyX
MEDRVQRLEELQSFAERDMEAMSAELKRAFDAIRALTARLDALDHRTASLENPVKLPEDERPPHSAGPRE